MYPLSSRYHEMGLYDTPALIDYILAETDHKTLITLGHSLGSTNVLIATSLRQEYQAKVRLNIMWGQGCLINHIRLREVLTSVYSSYMVRATTYNNGRRAQRDLRPFVSTVFLTRLNFNYLFRDSDHFRLFIWYKFN